MAKQDDLGTLIDLHLNRRLNTVRGGARKPMGLLGTIRGRRRGLGTRPIISFEPKVPEMPKAPLAPKAPRPPSKYSFLRGR